MIIRGERLSEYFIEFLWRLTLLIYPKEGGSHSDYNLHVGSSRITIKFHLKSIYEE